MQPEGISARASRSFRLLLAAVGRRRVLLWWTLLTAATSCFQLLHDSPFVVKNYRRLISYQLSKAPISFSLLPLVTVSAPVKKMVISRPSELLQFICGTQLPPAPPLCVIVAVGVLV